MAQHDANAEHVAARAAELAIEQQARLDVWMRTHNQKEEFLFFIQAVEVEASKQINYLLQQYALLKGYVHTGQRLRVTRPVTRGRTSDDR